MVTFFTPVMLLVIHVHDAVDQEEGVAVGEQVAAMSLMSISDGRSVLKSGKSSCVRDHLVAEEVLGEGHIGGVALDGRQARAPE